MNLNSGQDKQQRSLSLHLMSNIIYSFCHSITLHGYSYIVSTNSIALKIFWVFVILGMTTLAIFFLSINTMEFYASEMTTNIESSSEPLSVSIEFSF